MRVAEKNSAPSRCAIPLNRTMLVQSPAPEAGPSPQYTLVMLNRKILDDFSARLAELAATGPARDVEKNARALLNGLFARLDFVTREEFEVQRALLAHSREKLAALEARVAALEAQSAPPAPPRA